MNKKINIRLVGLLIAVSLIPQITFASWWNPFSWFKKTIPVVTSQILPVQQAEQSIVTQIIIPKKSVTKTTSPKITTDSSFFNPQLKTNTSYVPVDRLATDIVNYRSKTIQIFQEQMDAINKEITSEDIIVIVEGTVISDVNDKITGGEGFVIGNPDSKPTLDYLKGIFNAQIKYLQSEIDSRNKMTDWLKTALTNTTAELAQLQTATTKEQIDSHAKNIQVIKDNLANIKKASDDWNTGSHKIQVQIDGIMAGMKSANAPSTNTNNLPPIIINTPPAFTPAKFCLTEPTVIGTETHCY